MFFNPNSFRTVLCIRRKLACSNFSDNKKSRKEKGECFKFTCFKSKQLNSFPSSLSKMILKFFSNYVNCEGSIPS